MIGPVARAEILEAALRQILDSDELAELMWRDSRDPSDHRPPDACAAAIGTLAREALERAGEA